METPTDKTEQTQDTGPAMPEASPAAVASLPPVVVPTEVVANPDENNPVMGPPAIRARSVSSLPDDLGPEDFEAAIAETVLEFKEGDILEGHVVNMGQDEVLVDIGYKSEGVVPLKELSIRKNVTPDQIVSIGQKIEVLVVDKEDEQGRLILSKKRALYERVWGQIGSGQGEQGHCSGYRDRGGQGRVDRGHRTPGLPARLTGRSPPGS